MLVKELLALIAAHRLTGDEPICIRQWDGRGRDWRYQVSIASVEVMTRDFNSDSGSATSHLVIEIER